MTTVASNHSSSNVFLLDPPIPAIVTKNGKQFKKELKHTTYYGTLWRIYQAFQAAILTVPYFLICLIDKNKSNLAKIKWIIAKEGKTEEFRYIPILSKEEVAHFFKKAHGDFTQFDSEELIGGVEGAFNHVSVIKDFVDQTTMIQVAEKVAQLYLNESKIARAFQIRMQASQNSSPSPIFEDLEDKMSKADSQLGLKLQSLGSKMLKNHTLSIQERKYLDKKTNQVTTQIFVQARLTHSTRENLTKTLSKIYENPEFLQKYLPPEFSEVKISDEKTYFENRWDHESNQMGQYFEKHDGEQVKKDIKFDSKYGSLTALKFKGIGKIKIGSDPHCFSNYNVLTTELDPSVKVNEVAAKLHVIFGILGLGSLTSTIQPEDIERIKVMQLFRIYYPREAYLFERDPIAFEESIQSLKNRIVDKVPEMKEKFKQQLEKMYEQEIYSGQTVWAVHDFEKELKAAGAIGLMAGVGQTSMFEEHAFDEGVKRLIPMLKNGPMCSFDRFSAGIIKEGDSPGKDFLSGGAGSVFTRLMTKNMMAKSQTCTPPKFPLSGVLQILLDLKVLERGGYCYTHDNYGTKDPLYAQRPSMIELAQKIENEPSKFLDNEVCSLGHISHEFIKGVQVKTEPQKNKIIAALKKEGLVKLNDHGQESFNGVPLDKFIHVSETFKKEYWQTS